MFNSKKKRQDALGKDLHGGLVSIKDDIQLDKTLFGVFGRCFLVNEDLLKHNFLREETSADFL